jgi:hypothetical protein
MVGQFWVSLFVVLGNLYGCAGIAAPEMDKFNIINNQSRSY